MSKHKTIKQVHPRSITTTYCAQRGCKFRGKEAQQGVCYSDKGALVDWKRMAQQEQQVLDELTAIRKSKDLKAYVRTLEANYVTANVELAVHLGRSDSAPA